MAERSLTLKLLIDSRTNKVLFAEAGKEEVDFLFGLLTLPLGSVVKLLTKEKMVGSIGSMYDSLERLESTYFQDTNKKNLLLHYPKVKGDGIAKVEAEGGYVKDVFTYTVMDDLTVKPISPISSISLLNKFNVRSVDVLREETVKLGMQERLELLRVSLQSNNVLTDVFMEKKRGSATVLRPQLRPRNPRKS